MSDISALPPPSSSTSSDPSPPSSSSSVHRDRSRDRSAGRSSSDRRVRGSRDRSRDRSDRDRSDRDRDRDRHHRRDRDYRRSSRDRSRDRDHRDRSRSRSPRHDDGHDHDDDERRRKNRSSQRKKTSGWDQQIDPSTPTNTLPPSMNNGGLFSAGIVSGPPPLLSAVVPQQITPIMPSIMAPPPAIPPPSIPSLANIPLPPKAQLLSTASKMDRRVYVGSLHYELTEEDIKVPFSHFGVVVKVDMPRDPGQMRSKGFCFIEYEKPESAQMAMMAMNGFLLAGRQIKVGRATGSGETQTYGLDARALASLGAANAASMQAQAQQMAQNAAMALANGGMGGGGGGMNMNGQPMQSPYHQHNNMNNNNNMMMNTNNNNNNPSPPVMSSIPNPSALAAQAAQAAAAAAAAQSAAQKRIYVGNIHYEISETQLRPIFEAFGPITGIQMMMNTDGSNKHKGFCFITFEHDKSAKMAIDAMNGFELAGRPIKVNWATATAAAGVSSTSPAPIINNINIPSPSSILPSSVPTPQLPVSLTREENVRISSQSQRQQLMAKLAHTESPVILLKNMVTADDVDGDLEGEIREECEKSGPVIKVFIYTDPNSSKVNIYVHFAHVNAASQARLALDQRYFGGNIVQANFYPLTKFEAGIFQDE